MEHIEFTDQKLSIKKTKSRLLQSNENILELIQAWNRLKLESKMQDFKTKLILTKKIVNNVEVNIINQVNFLIIYLLIKNNPKLNSPTIMKQLKSSETNKSRSSTSKKLVRQKSFEESLEQLNAVSSIEIYNDVISNEIYNTITNENEFTRLVDSKTSKNKNTQLQSSFKSSCKTSEDVNNNFNKDDDDEFNDDDDIDTIDDSEPITPVNKTNYELNNLNKQTVKPIEN